MMWPDEWLDSDAIEAMLEDDISKPPRRIKVLDGWRGLAILMVCSSHIGGRTRFNGSLLANLGLLGVDVFFVLSGFVITRSLLIERERTGSFSLPAFYKRRIFRILPAAMIFLAVLALLDRFMNLGNLSIQSFVASALFYRNYWLSLHPSSAIYTNHYWSLSIEEQFYFFWPAVLLFLGNRKAMWFAGVTGSACALWRLYSYRFMPGADERVFWMMRTQYRVDGLALGCLLALLLSYPRVRRFIDKNFAKEVPIFCAFAVILNYQHSFYCPSLITYMLIAVAMASTLIVKEGLVYQCLTSRVLLWLGSISFSLYLWQQLFLVSPFPGYSPFGKFGVFPFNAAAAVLVASASYYFIEEPIRTLGHKPLIAYPAINRMETCPEMAKFQRRAVPSGIDLPADTIRS